MDALTQSLHQFIIRRVGRGFVVEWVMDGKSLFCGASGAWMGNAQDAGIPFPTFQGAEWFITDWRL